MKQYKILISNDANKDIKHLFDFIENNYHATLTAKKYIDGLLTAIRFLTLTADSLPISHRKLFLKYGMEQMYIVKLLKKRLLFIQFMVVLFIYIESYPVF
jgi:hypothetical protein